MTVACGLISSIFIGQAIVMLITVGVELHCGFNILCVLETLSPLPLMGRIPHMRHGAIVVDFETGMMDNIVGALSGYLSAIIITVWALTRHHHWLALRLSAVVAAAIIALIASQITVYNHIKDRVDSSTIDLLVECTSPQGIVGLAAIWSTGMLMRDSKRWPRDKERLVLSWTVTAAKLLLSAVTLFELAFAVTDIVAPGGRRRNVPHAHRLLAKSIAIARLLDSAQRGDDRGWQLALASARDRSEAHASPHRSAAHAERALSHRNDTELGGIDRRPAPIAPDKVPDPGPEPCGGHRMRLRHLHRHQRAHIACIHCTCADHVHTTASHWQ
jgi:hypothetical protein